MQMNKLPNKIPEIEKEVWKPHIANFAPLSEALAAHIFSVPHAIRLPSYRQDPPGIFDQLWRQIHQARQIVSHLLVPAVESEAGERKVVPDWFRRNFEVYAGRAKLAPTTAQEWINKRHLRSIKHSMLEPNSVASLYMMRYLFQRNYHRWLPPEQEENQPWFYVWGLLPNTNIPRVFPYPLPEDLPANTLCWTHWIGASWCPGWIKVPGIGSLAWGKTVERSGKWYWSLAEEEMSVWDTSLIRATNVRYRLELLSPMFQHQNMGYPDAEERYHLTRMHDLANLLLQHIGEPILAGHIKHYFECERPPTKPYIPF